MLLEWRGEVTDRRPVCIEGKHGTPALLAVANPVLASNDGRGQLGEQLLKSGMRTDPIQGASARPMTSPGLETLDCPYGVYAPGSRIGRSMLI